MNICGGALSPALVHMQWPRKMKTHQICGQSVERWPWPQLELACNEASAKAAQDFFNRTASNSGVSLRLKNPRLVSKTETSVKCRVNSNINQDMYYHLELQDDGTVLIVFGCDMTERTNSLLQK